MLTKVLDASDHPFVVLHLEALSGRQSVINVVADITLHGVTRKQRVAVTVGKETNGIRFVGVFSVNQTDFGLKPFEALGGLLKVQDSVDIQFDLHAIPDS